MRQPISAAAWLILFGLMLIVPLVFTSATLEAFETPKVALLHLSAIVLIALGIVASTTGLESLRLGWRDPVFLAVMGFLLSAALSTALSMSPHVSFFGGIESHAGLITVLSFVALFVATRACVKTSTHACRLLVAPVIAAGLVA